jgi:nucleotide-binding universal stress UspA family protein
MESPTPKQAFNILLATDGSEHAMAAASLVNDLALTPGSTVTIVAVLIPRQASSFSLLETALQQTRARIENPDINVRTQLETGYPAERIYELSEDHEVDLVVLGAKGHRHTLGILLGGVAQQVVEYVQAPILVVRSPYRRPKRIMVAVDASPCSQHVLEFLSGSGFYPTFPVPGGAAISVVHVLPPVDLYPRYIPTIHHGQINVPPDEDFETRLEEEKLHGQDLLRRAVECLASSGIDASQELLSGDAATEIIKYARKRKMDLILAGSRGMGAVKAFLLGSVSRKLVHYAQCSVLVVK